MPDNPKEKITVYVDPEIVKRARHQKIDDKISLSELIEKALREYLK